MAPVLPSSISPHVATLLSPDLVQLLASSGLPPLDHILQSYSPLPAITTRTVALTPVPHTSFALRFSDLAEIEFACKEDEEAHAGRLIDWLGTRISRRAARWAEDAEPKLNATENRTLWWEEVRKCVEGDWSPSRSEGWNHPVAIIHAVSTTAPNPLQAMAALYSRPIDLPTWVDSTILRYNLVIHPANSSFSSDECNALVNAIKKQYSLNTNLVKLSMDRPQSAIPILPMPPRLPPPIEHSYANGNSGAVSEVQDVDELLMTEADAQAVGKFVREFVTTALLPWMERNIIDWNENFNATRRVSSRLFSTTKRLFGGAAPPISPSAPSLPLSMTTPISPYGTHFHSPPPPQNRRLAEFATFLGDYKVALTVWDSLRKEGKGGAEVLPLLLAPSPTLFGYAAEALQGVLNPDPSASAQLRALLHAVRWEGGMQSQDLLLIGAERWLAWAAGTAEEPPAALLLAHAAHLSRKRGALRRAAMWYTLAAGRLEKVGIKPLTVHFLHIAHQILSQSPQKLLPSSFKEAERSPRGEKKHSPGFDGVLTNIEHSLARLKYTMGDSEAAVRFFLGLLRGDSDSRPVGSDPIILGDFRQAFQLLASAQPNGVPIGVSLPFNLCSGKNSKIRLGRLDEDLSKEMTTTWNSLQNIWRKHMRGRGETNLDGGGQAEIGETFWVDLSIHNPLESEVTLGDLTVVVEADAEVIDEVMLNPKETRLIPIAVTPRSSGSLTIRSVQYRFLCLLPITEPLSIPGRRLNDTPTQRHDIVYAPDTLLGVNVRSGGCRLDVDFLDDDADSLVDLVHGEIKRVILRARNAGSATIEEVWVIGGEELCIWIDENGETPSETSTAGPTRTITSSNSILSPEPKRINLSTLHDGRSLAPGEYVNIPIVLYSQQSGASNLSLLFTYRENAENQFFTTRLQRTLHVSHILDVRATVQASPSLESTFILRLEVENMSEEVELDIQQVSAVSTGWVCEPPSSMLRSIESLQSGQIGRVIAELSPAPHLQPTASIPFVRERLGEFLSGQGVSPTEPPEALLAMCYLSEKISSMNADPYGQHFLSSSRRAYVRQTLASEFPSISEDVRHRIFPLYTPHTFDIYIYWEINTFDIVRNGCCILRGLCVGAGHESLREVLQKAENGKDNSMYAETQREKEALLGALQSSEWNLEMDPLVVKVKTRNSIVEHDFRQGPCTVEVAFILHNVSLTHPSRCLLRLPASTTGQTYPPNYLPPKYQGKLLHRATLGPGEHQTFQVVFWASRPGQYGIGAWHIENDVGEIGSTAQSWRTRSRYLQGPSGEGCVVVRALG